MQYEFIIPSVTSERNEKRVLGTCIFGGRLACATLSFRLRGPRTPNPEVV